MFPDCPGLTRIRIALISGIENDKAMSSIYDSADDTETQDTPVAPVPWTTISLLVLLGVIFLTQVGAARWPGSDISDLKVPDLVIFGAFNHDLVVIAGEWWRMLTAPLLHSGIAHVTLNGVALFFAGRFLEQHLGGVVLVGMLCIGAVAGSLVSLAVDDTGLVSMGASGGIMALIAAAALLCYTLPEAADTLSGRSLFLRILVPSLIPTSDGIDYAAHFGGAIMGGGVAGLLAGWGWLERHVAVLRWVLLGAVIAYAAGALFGGIQLMRAAPGFDPDAVSMETKPAQALIGSDETAARALVVKYPGDPQARLILSVALYLADKPAEAEKEAIMGLRQIRTYGSGLFELVVEPEIKAMIALSRAVRGDAFALTSFDDSCPGLSPEFRAKVLIKPDTRAFCAGR